jgi:hypothetical protein
MPSYSLFFVSFASMGWSARERVVRGCLTAGIKRTCSEIHNNPKKNDTSFVIVFGSSFKKKKKEFYVGPSNVSLTLGFFFSLNEFFACSIFIHPLLKQWICKNKKF